MPRSLNIVDFSQSMGWMLVGIMIGFVIISVMNFQSQLSNLLLKILPQNVNLLPYGLFDDSLISVFNNISEQVPENETVVISNHGPLFEYLTHRHIVIPRVAYSDESLVEYMSKNDYKYLVVFEGSSQVQSLKTLFSSKGLSKLNNLFNKLGYYNTSDSKIHFYKINT